MPAKRPTRSTAILIRLTVAERKEIEAAAADTGMGAGPYLRVLGLAAARDTSPNSLVATLIGGGARVMRRDREG
jgi:hypothetical protein